MKIINVYLLHVYVIPLKKQAIIEAVLKLYNLEYGNYKQVYFESSPDIVFFSPKQGSAEEISNLYENKTIKLEFSIQKDDALLKKILKAISIAHPWKEPVIRIFNAQETRQ